MYNIFETLMRAHFMYSGKPSCVAIIPCLRCLVSVCFYLYMKLVCHDMWRIDDLLDHTISKNKTVNFTYSTQELFTTDHWHLLRCATVLVLRTWSTRSLTCRGHSVARCGSSSRFLGPFSRRRPVIAARSLCWSAQTWCRPAPADRSAAPVSWIVVNC